MLSYLISDVGAMLEHLPQWGIAAAAMVLISVSGNIGRKAMGKQPHPVIGTALFWTYILTIIVITFLSREPGTRQGFDLQIGSTWAINNRNKALVIENVLLFIPFGFFAAWSQPAMRNFFNSLFWGLIFSWGIECMQLVTQRGYFQIDDIITNVLGTLIGFLIYTLGHWSLKGLTGKHRKEEW